MEVVVDVVGDFHAGRGDQQVSLINATERAAVLNLKLNKILVRRFFIAVSNGIIMTYEIKCIHLADLYYTNRYNSLKEGFRRLQATWVASGRQ